MSNPRPLHVIAKEIEQDWRKPYGSSYISKVNPAARPYLNAMKNMIFVEENYGADSGKSVVLYFLANAGTWRGETARRIKKELNALVK